MVTSPATTAAVDQVGASIRDYLDCKEFDWEKDKHGAEVVLLYFADVYLWAKTRPGTDVDAVMGLALTAFTGVVDDA